MRKSLKSLLVFMPFLGMLGACGKTAVSSVVSSSASSEVSSEVSSDASSEASSDVSSEAGFSASSAADYALGKHTLFVVGDSTVCDFPSETYYYRRYGWGTQLDKYFNTTDYLSVNNLALSGRSSKSFLSEANYTALTSGIKEGDFLLIGFGHNDEKAETARYTNPNGDYQTEGSFAKSLYDNYVKVALDVGAYPVLCTPICRYNASGDYTGSSAHITTTSGEYAGGDYAQAIRDLGKAVNVPVVDLTADTKALYTNADYTADDITHLFAWSTPTSMYDTTHTSIWGAKFNAYFIAKELKDSASYLGKYVLDNIAAPTRAADLTVNPSYVAGATDGSFTASALYTTVKDPWYGTAMGTGLGGNPSEANKALIGDITEGEDLKSFNIRAGVPTDATPGVKGGKMSNSAEGFLMAFQSKDIDNDYLISAKMTINQLPGDGADIATMKQIGFGLMMRGDITIDEKSGGLTNYASAGIYLTSTAACAPFYRSSASALTPSTNDFDESSIKEGASFDLSIKKLNTQADGTADYLCTIGSYSETFTVNIKQATSNKMFIGCFASRSCDVTFSDVSVVNQN